MKVLYNWLKELVPALSAEPAELARALTGAGIEVDGVMPTEEGDWVIELDLTPNRSDCLSMWGVAHEVAAIYGLEANLPQNEDLQVKIDEEKIKLEIPDLCPYYLGLILQDVKIGPSPLWLAHRLEALGMRSINNIVDITNYVMLETGQPLHAFDYDSLENHKIVVRGASAQEELVTLDGQLRKLPEGTILICDQHKAIGIGGVMGGLNSETTSETKNIFFEAAYFERRSIRRSAKTLDLRSEAAIRFEKGVDPTGLYRALQRVHYYSQLLGIGTPNGEILSGSFYHPKAQQKINLRREYLNNRIGLAFEEDQIVNTLHSLGFEVETTPKGWLVDVPARRQDIQEEVDLTEEIARLIGFEQIPAQLPLGETTQGGLSKKQKLINKIHTVLNARGLHEALNYSFISEKELSDFYTEEDHILRKVIRLKNPMSEAQEIMRTTLLPGLLKNLVYNQNRQNTDLGIYELGRVYLPLNLPLTDLPKEELKLSIALMGNLAPISWHQEKKEAGFYLLKGILEDVMGVLGWSLNIRANQEDSRFHPFQCGDIIFNGKKMGIMGTMHPKMAEAWGLNKPVFLADLNLDELLKLAEPGLNYRSISRFQASRRDLALVVEEDINAQAVIETIKLGGGSLLERVELFDVYQGSQIKEGYKSLAFSLTYRAFDRTLTEAEVAKAHNEILQFLNNYYQSELRK